MNGPLCPTHPR